MLKIVCLFAVLAVALADVRPVPPPSAIPVQHPRALVQPVVPGNGNDKPAVPVNSDVQTPDGPSGDMDKAETFGFGYHKHYYVAPRYYGGYYGGYYPYYGHHYGYPYYY
nr:uncharacterized protein LOC115263364 [Aedes albopictus]